MSAVLKHIYTPMINDALRRDRIRYDDVDRLLDELTSDPDKVMDTFFDIGIWADRRDEHPEQYETAVRANYNRNLFIHIVDAILSTPIIRMNGFSDEVELILMRLRTSVDPDTSVLGGVLITFMGTPVVFLENTAPQVHRVGPLFVMDIRVMREMFESMFSNAVVKLQLEPPTKEVDLGYAAECCVFFTFLFLVMIVIFHLLVYISEADKLKHAPEGI